MTLIESISLVNLVRPGFCDFERMVQTTKQNVLDYFVNVLDYFVVVSHKLMDNFCYQLRASRNSCWTESINW